MEEELERRGRAEEECRDENQNGVPAAEDDDRDRDEALPRAHVLGERARMGRLSVEAAGFGSDSPVGLRAAGLGQPEGAIYLTEDAGDVLRQLVAQELRAAGHQLEADDPQVEVTVHVLAFEVQIEPRSLLWDVRAEIRMALELVGEQGSTTTTGKFIYTVERRGSSVLWPAIGTAVRILAECLADLAKLIAERDAFGAALAKVASSRP